MLGENKIILYLNFEGEFFGISSVLVKIDLRDTAVALENAIYSIYTIQDFNKILNRFFIILVCY